MTLCKPCEDKIRKEYEGKCSNCNVELPPQKKGKLFGDPLAIIQ